MISFDFWKVYEFRKSRLVYYIWLLSLFNSFNSNMYLQCGEKIVQRKDYLVT